MSDPAKTAFDLPEKDLDGSDRVVLRQVTEFGWHVVLIPEHEKGPGFAFTDGLFHTYGHPEQIVAEANYAEFVDSAMWFYRRNAFPLLQVLWPDKRKRFPGDPSCPKGMLKHQPRLKEP